MNHSKTNGFSWWKRLQSFKYAFKGLKKFFRTEHNAWLHLALTIISVLLSIALKVTPTEIIFLVLVTGSVWTAELINTAIEKAMDFISVEKRVEIKWIKDLSAAAVLITAVTALITGCMIFIPKIV